MFPTHINLFHIPLHHLSHLPLDHRRSVETFSADGKFLLPESPICEGMLRSTVFAIATMRALVFSLVWLGERN